MSDKHFLDDQTDIDRLRYWGLGQMMRGAFLGGAFFVAILAVVYLIWGLGLLLPEESKQAPSPYGALETIQPLNTGSA